MWKFSVGDMMNIDFLDSKPVCQAFLCIVRGKNYAAAIQNTMKVKPPSVFRYIKILLNAGLIETNPDGRIVRYLPVWNEVSRFWLNWVVKQRLKNLEREPVRFLIGEEKKEEVDVEKRYPSHAHFERVKKRINDTRKLIDKDKMVYFTRLVMETYAELNSEGYSLEDLFAFYAYEMLPELEKSKLINDNYPFYSELKTEEKDEYSMGCLTANLLRTKIMCGQRKGEMSHDEANALRALLRDRTI